MSIARVWIIDILLSKNDKRSKVSHQPWAKVQDERCQLKGFVSLKYILSKNACNQKWATSPGQTMSSILVNGHSCQIWQQKNLTKIQHKIIWKKNYQNLSKKYNIRDSSVWYASFLMLNEKLHGKTVIILDKISTDFYCQNIKLCIKWIINHVRGE